MRAVCKAFATQAHGHELRILGKCVDFWLNPAVRAIPSMPLTLRRVHILGFRGVAS